jgi:hypothetical protein
VSESPETLEAPETPDTEESDQQYGRLPDDHPAVRKLADYKSQIKDLKPKAVKLTEMLEAQKTQQEKDAERISQAEAEAASVPAKVADALRTHLVALHEIDPEDAELFLTATEPGLMLKQVSRLLGQSDKRRRNHVPKEGQTPSVAAETSDMREFTRQLFGDQ